ncbi:hypothetical protein PVK06_018907 [Gossypium arboreum]|uniref:Uncharacterized protein n=1 Tax=Gossypium arboreum TaxID=29729 RepID=A0ABR0PIG9_GOSAR|nr:hypothetical protein PVK06_018907 [Gossypium arboreum]
MAFADPTTSKIAIMLNQKSLHATFVNNSQNWAFNLEDRLVHFIKTSLSMVDYVQHERERQESQQQLFGASLSRSQTQKSGKGRALYPHPHVVGSTHGAKSMHARQTGSIHVVLKEGKQLQPAIVCILAMPALKTGAKN